MGRGLGVPLEGPEGLSDMMGEVSKEVENGKSSFENELLEIYRGQVW